MSRRLSPSELLALAGVSSLCAVVYELTIASCFVELSGDAPLWQSLTLGLFVFAAGAGAWACSRLGRARMPDAWLWLWGAQLVLAAAGALCAVGVLAADTALNIYRNFYAALQPPKAAAVAFLSLAHGGTLLLGSLAGFGLALFARLGEETSADGKDRTREVLAVAGAGVLVGSLAFAFFLHPALQATGSAAAASALNLAVCAFLYARAPDSHDDLRTGALVTAVAMWVALLFISPRMARLDAASFHAVRILATQECFAGKASGLGAVVRDLIARSGGVERIPSARRRIELVTGGDRDASGRDPFNARPAAEPERPYELWLYLDRQFRFYGGREALLYEFLAHVPVQLFDIAPKDVLILGGGDGLLAKELLKYGKHVRSIVNVEADPALLRLASNDPRLRSLNEDSLRNPKVKNVIAEAFDFTRRDGRRFDAVYIDFPLPSTYDAANAYSAEFFRDVERRLKPGGFGAMRYPLASNDSLARRPDKEGLRRNSIAVSTLRAGGFQTIIPFDTECPELVLYDDAVRWAVAALPEDHNPETARLMRKVLARRFLTRYPGLTADESEDHFVIDNRDARDSMLTFTRGRVAGDFRFKDHGLKLYALNARRLLTLEDRRFPFKDDPSLTNTLARPTLFKSPHLPD